MEFLWKNESFVLLKIDFNDVVRNHNKFEATCKALIKNDSVLLKLLYIWYQTGYNDLNSNKVTKKISSSDI